MKQRHVWMAVFILLVGLSVWAGAQIADKAVCPVCGATVNVAEAKWTADHNGKTYYFGSEKCKEAFLKDPGKFLAKKTDAAPAAAGCAESTKSGAACCPKMAHVKNVQAQAAMAGAAEMAAPCEKATAAAPCAQAQAAGKKCEMAAGAAPMAGMPAHQGGCCCGCCAMMKMHGGMAMHMMMPPAPPVPPAPGQPNPAEAPVPNPAAVPAAAAPCAPPASPAPGMMPNMPHMQGGCPMMMNGRMRMGMMMPRKHMMMRQGGPMGSGFGPGMGMGMMGPGMMMMEDVEKKVETTKDGVVIAITSKNPETVKKIQEHIAAMAKREAEMMEMMKKAGAGKDIKVEIKEEKK